ncbi:MAG: S41 family peptidase [Hyphomonadaceae bacterium]|nr:S41 family peptidase [Hyphomonadaceae bacterium]
MMMQASRRDLLAGVAAGAGLALIPSAAAAQELTFAPAALREDLAVLERAWTTMHPGLLRYNTPASIARLFAEARDWANAERSLGAFFVELARVSAAVRCGHTFPNPSNQGRRARETLIEPTRCVPFAFRWIEGEMIVTAAMADTGLRAGDRVLRLDGVSSRTLRRRLMPLMRADGGNDAKRIVLMSVDPKDDHATFDLYRGLVFGAGAACEVEIVRQGARSRLSVSTVTADARRAALGQNGPNENWSFSIEEGIGRLTMPDWALYDSEWDWRGFIDESVDQLIDAQARGLIVDLRSNEGGLGCGDTLLERLIEQPLAPQRSRTRVRYRRAPADLDPYLETWDPSFKDWGEAAVGPDADGFYDLRRADEVEQPLVPRGRRFNGDLVVLTDASMSSATFQFAQKVKDNRLGVLVGETTGGSRRGINGGAYFFFRLPNSRLEVDLPLIGYFPETPQPDEGTLPDRHVTQTAADLAIGFDRVADVALGMLGR